MKNKSKIVVTILAALAIILVVVLLIIKLRQNGVIGSVDSNRIVKEFNKIYNSEERSVIYYASPTCGYCNMLSPILDTISEDYDMDYFYLDSTKLSNSERKAVLDKLEIERHATPITIIVEKGKVIDKLEGYVAGKEYVEFFKNNGMVPEDAKYSPEANINYIEFDEYKELIKEESKNVIVVGQTTCSHCTAIKPALNSVSSEYEIKINYINVDVLSEDDSKEFFDTLKLMEYSDPDFVEKGSFGTPLILVVKNGKIRNYISGERTTSQLVKEFKKIGLIEE